jgi:hypothetical protein
MSSDLVARLRSGAFRARLAARSLEDEAFRRELLANPRSAIEGELSILVGKPVQLPAGVRLEVHEESGDVVQFIVPAALLPHEEDNDMLIFWEHILRPGS